MTIATKLGFRGRLYKGKVLTFLKLVVFNMTHLVSPAIECYRDVYLLPYY